MSNSPQNRKAAVFPLVSVLSVLCAIGSFATGAILGLVLAVLAILFGTLGAAASFLPGVRGGVASTFAIVAGCIGILAAIIKAIGWF
ncbi:MAG: hypothetical protein KDN18_03030, partial [Verrucomicrobiae bacterium]|nr:hypothetical protein [Verrucomicrobiae bacterium]